MSVIGEEIERYDNFKNRFDYFTLLCCSLAMITFAFMTYLCWVEQRVVFGGRYGSPDRLEEGASAIQSGYFMFICFMASLGAGFWNFYFKRFIWLILFIIWLTIVIMVYKHFNP